MSDISGPTTPLGDTVRIGDLVLEPGGAVTVGGTTFPSGVRLQDCVLGSGPDRAILAKTPEGVVTIERGGRTLVFAWSAPGNRWYGPGPEPTRPSPPFVAMLARRRHSLAALAVLLALFWAYSRTKPVPTEPAPPSRPTPPETSTGVIDRVDRGPTPPTPPAGAGEDPFAEIVETIEGQLEAGRLGQEPLALAAGQVEELVDGYAAQAKTAKLLAEEIRPLQMRVEDVDWVLLGLKDDAGLPFELRRRFARLADPGAGEALHAMAMGEDSLERIAQRADAQAGRLLRGEEGRFTKADILRAIRDHEALAAAHDLLRERHGLVDALLAEVPFTRLKQALSPLGKSERGQKFAAMHGVPLEATFDARSADLEELFLALDRLDPAFLLVDAEDQEITMEMLASFKPPDLFGRPTAADERADREAKRLIGAYAARHSAVPARLARVARGVEEGRRAARTTFAPLLAE